MTDAAVRSVPMGPPVPTVRGTALVVDDSRVNRTLISALLARRGYRVLEADDGVDAVERFSRERVDLVFMDVVMPRMDGYEATMRIRERAGDRYVPVVFLTAMNTRPGLERCIEAGGDEFFSKPFDPDELDLRLTVIERMKGMHDTIRAQRNTLAEHARQERVEREIAEELMARVVRIDPIAQEVIRHEIRGATTFSGDLVTCCRTPEGLLRVLVGDVTGHGLPAAIAGLVAATTFEECTTGGVRFTPSLRQLNARLRSVLPEGVFLAAVAIEIDARRGLLRIWNGGMPPVRLVGAAAGRTLEPWGLPLGILDNSEFAPSPRAVPVEEGDRVLVVSDGVIEARSPDGALLGEARLERILDRTGGEAPFDRVLQTLDLFTGGTSQADDCTVVELRVPPAVAFDVPQLGPRAPGSWEQVIRIAGPSLGRQDPLATLGFVLTDTGLGDELRERVMTVASELVANAIDHGVLGLESAIKDAPDGIFEWLQAREAALATVRDGWVELRVAYEGHAERSSLMLMVSDSGGGWPSTSHEASPDAPWGRGLRIVEELSTRTEVCPAGSCVEAYFEW